MGMLRNELCDCLWCRIFRISAYPGLEPCECIFRVYAMWVYVWCVRPLDCQWDSCLRFNVFQTHHVCSLSHTHSFSHTHTLSPGFLVQSEFRATLSGAFLVLCTSCCVPISCAYTCFLSLRSSPTRTHVLTLSFFYTHTFRVVILSYLRSKSQISNVSGSHQSQPTGTLYD